MPDESQKNPSGIAGRWLAAFDRAVAASDPAALGALFHRDGHWRDLLAFTWHIETVSGGEAVAERLGRRAGPAGASGFAVDRGRTPPRRVTRAGREAVEAIFGFVTACGRGSGVLRLTADGAADGAGGAPKAWTLLTALDELRGFEERLGKARPTGESWSRDFRGPNWLDRRRSAAAYADREPAVLVVGGGQAGLSIAARLIQLGVDALVADRGTRIGDCWRNRYHALTLHNRVQVNHLPYMPFPPNWPAYLPKDKVAGWFEAYAESMELNVWTGAEFVGGAYDDRNRRWSVALRRADGSERRLHPRHVVMATGVSGVPSLPALPGMETFGGAVLHSSEYDHAADWRGRRALVIGTGNSGHDIAQDLHSNGAEVTLVQRSPTTVVNVEPSAQLPYALYDEGPALEDCDLIAAAMPYAPMKEAHRRMTAEARALDRDLLDRLRRRGFRLDFGEDGTGWQFKYLRRGGGYYFNVGCSDLIADGEIRLVQLADIDSFVAAGARLRTGGTLPADLVVLATGFKGQDHLVRLLFGDDMADRVGPVWGFDDRRQELRNMWTRTAQPGLWFIAGSFAQCRIYSRYLALQIKACEEGMIPLLRPAG